MDNGKFYYWNWDTSETTWKRPKDYDSAEDANPETAAAAIAKRKSAGSSGGPTAAATAGSKRGTPAKDGERSSKQEARQREAKAFRKLLAEGVEVKKFSQNSRFRAKPSARVLWLDTRSQVSEAAGRLLCGQRLHAAHSFFLSFTSPIQTLFWQKGSKNPAKIKADASLRLSDIVDVSVGISTATLKKSGSEDKADRYLSLVGRGSAKNLDIEVSSVKQRNSLSKGFKLLLAV